MKVRYQELHTTDLGGILTSRLLDSAKLLHGARRPTFPEPLLRAVAERVRGNAPLAQETWDALKERTVTQGFGQFNAAGDFLIYRPYLEQCVTYEPTPDDYAALLNLLSERADAEGLLYLGVACHERDSHLAEVAYREATRAGVAAAWLNLGNLLTKQGRDTEAEAAYREATRAGLAAAWNNLDIDPQKVVEILEFEGHEFTEMCKAYLKIAMTDAENQLKLNPGNYDKIAVAKKLVRVGVLEDIYRFGGTYLIHKLTPKGEKVYTILKDKA